MSSIDGIVLVHGGHHDRSCWEQLIPLLDLPAIAVDLPGRGDRPIGDEPVTLRRCAEAVLADASAAGFDRFLLVGHSMGGLTITQLATDQPQRVAHLVYVGALVLAPGVTVSDLYKTAIENDPTAMLPAPELEGARLLFANDMTDEQWERAQGCVVPEAASLFHETLTSYPTGVPTTYVQMTQDRPVPPELAAHMIEQLNPETEVLEIDAAHNVMLSQPDTLAAILNKLGKPAA